MERTLDQSLSAKAYHLIKNDIVSCLLEPGTFIVQTDLAEKYGVGVTPIREALRQLAHEGFIQAIPRIGYVISQITVQDVQEIYEMRYILETASANLAATRASMDQLESIARSANFTYTYKDRLSYTHFLNENAKFHYSIAAATGNKRLSEQVFRSLDELNRVFHLGLDLRDSAEEMRSDHVDLARALCSRDAKKAGLLVQQEVLRSRERVLEALKKFPHPEISSMSSISFNFQKDESQVES